MTIYIGRRPRRRPTSRPHPLARALRRRGWSQDKATRRWSHPDHPRRDCCQSHDGGRLVPAYTLKAAARRAGLIRR